MLLFVGQPNQIPPFFTVYPITNNNSFSQKNKKKVNKSSFIFLVHGKLIEVHTEHLMYELPVFQHRMQDVIERF